MQLDSSRSAVLALHFERDTIEPERAFGAFFDPMIKRNGVLDNTARALAAARAAGLPVIYVVVQFVEGYPGLDSDTALNRAAIDTRSLLAGTAGTEIVDALAPQPQDTVIDHPGGTSAFRSASLAPLLAERGIDTLIVAGVSTNIIVEGTVHDALNRDLRVFVLTDCCACADETTQEVSLGTLGMISHGLLTSHELADAVTTVRV
jgi:biuret amidohydrolase